MGVYPDREKKISKINEYTLKEEGSRSSTIPPRNDILISKSLAEKLDVSVGDKIVLMVQDKNNEMSGVGLTVRGFFQTPVRDYDNGVVYMGIKRLQEITGLKDNVSEIMVITTNKDIVDSVKPRLVKSINDKGLEILTWKEMAPFLLSAIGLHGQADADLLRDHFITMIFSIANTLIMSIMERFHELGVMKSIGTRPSQIFFIIMFEAMNLGAVGLAAGVAISIAAVNILAINGHRLFTFHGGDAPVGDRQHHLSRCIYRQRYIISIVVVELTTLLAAIYPAVKAARIKPLEALHYI